MIRSQCKIFYINIVSKLISNLIFIIYIDHKYVCIINILFSYSYMNDFIEEACYLYTPKLQTPQHLLSTFSLSINYFTHFTFFYNFFLSSLCLSVQGCLPTQWYKKHFSLQKYILTCENFMTLSYVRFYHRLNALVSLILGITFLINDKN